MLPRRMQFSFHNIKEKNKSTLCLMVFLNIAKLIQVPVEWWSATVNHYHVLVQKYSPIHYQSIFVDVPSKHFVVQILLSSERYKHIPTSKRQCFKWKYLFTPKKRTFMKYQCSFSWLIATLNFGAIRINDLNITNWHIENYKFKSFPGNW